MPKIELPYFLYRAADETGELLYIGITSNVALRVGQHATAKPWWPEVADIQVEMFPCHKSALAAEKAAIKEGKPRFNITHAKPRKDVRSRVARASLSGRTVTYHVNAEWDDTGVWVITIPDVPGAISQSRRLEQVPEDAAEVIEIQTGTPVDPKTLVIHPRLPGEAGEAAAAARHLRKQEAELRDKLEEQTRRAVIELKRKGFPLRDIGELTGISYQRAQQIAKVS